MTAIGNFWMLFLAWKMEVIWKKEKNLLSKNKQQKSRRYTTTKKRLLDPHLKQTWRNPYSVKCGKHSFAAVSIS